MMDENFDRTYQAGRADLNAGIDRLATRIGKSVAESFDVLHRIQWSAPWNSNSKDVHCA